MPETSAGMCDSAHSTACRFAQTRRRRDADFWKQQSWSGRLHQVCDRVSVQQKICLGAMAAVIGRMFSLCSHFQVPNEIFDIWT